MLSLLCPGRTHRGGTAHPDNEIFTCGQDREKTVDTVHFRVNQHAVLQLPRQDWITNPNGKTLSLSLSLTTAVNLVYSRVEIRL